MVRQALCGGYQGLLAKWLGRFWPVAPRGLKQTSLFVRHSSIEAPKLLLDSKRPSTLDQQPALAQMEIQLQFEAKPQLGDNRHPSHWIGENSDPHT
jgi:hypothetical protein